MNTSSSFASKPGGPVPAPAAGVGPLLSPPPPSTGSATTGPTAPLASSTPSAPLATSVAAPAGGIPLPALATGATPADAHATTTALAATMKTADQQNSSPIRQRTSSSRKTSSQGPRVSMMAHGRTYGDPATNHKDRKDSNAKPPDWLKYRSGKGSPRKANGSYFDDGSSSEESSDGGLGYKSNSEDDEQTFVHGAHAEDDPEAARHKRKLERRRTNHHRLRLLKKSRTPSPDELERLGIQRTGVFSSRPIDGSSEPSDSQLPWLCDKCNIMNSSMYIRCKHCDRRRPYSPNTQRQIKEAKEAKMLHKVNVQLKQKMMEIMNKLEYTLKEKQISELTTTMDQLRKNGLEMKRLIENSHIHLRLSQLEDGIFKKNMELEPVLKENRAIVSEVNRCKRQQKESDYMMMTKDLLEGQDKLASEIKMLKEKIGQYQLRHELDERTMKKNHELVVLLDGKVRVLEGKHVPQSYDPRNLDFNDQLSKTEKDVDEIKLSIEAVKMKVNQTMEAITSKQRENDGSQSARGSVKTNVGDTKDGSLSARGPAVTWLPEGMASPRKMSGGFTIKDAIRKEREFKEKEMSEASKRVEVEKRQKEEQILALNSYSAQIGYAGHNDEADEEDDEVPLTFITQGDKNGKGGKKKEANKGAGKDAAGGKDKNNLKTKGK